MKNIYFLPILIGSFFLLLSLAVHSQNNIDEIKFLLKDGKYVRAETLTNKSIEENLNDPELLFYKGIIETNMGKNNQAIDTFRDLTERFPTLPEPFNNLAVLYAEKGQYDLAKKILEQAIKTNPSYLTAHINLGDIFTKMASEAYNNACPGAWLYFFIHSTSHAWVSVRTSHLAPQKVLASASPFIL